MKDILQFLPKNLEIEDFPQVERIFEFNNKQIKNGEVVYLMERELRLKENFSLNFAKQKAKELKTDLIIIHPKQTYDTREKNDFLNINLRKLNKDIEIFDGDDEKLLTHLNSIPTGLLVIDFNPIRDFGFLKKANFKIFEIDSHNIIPARFISDKQEYSAATLRRKIHNNIFRFFTKFSEKFEPLEPLEDFLENKLESYNELRNDPTKNATSNLSKYFNLGFISAKTVAIKILQSPVSDINKNVFLEELIVRKELSDNFCLYNKKFKTLDGTPTWAKDTLKKHESDFRFYVYSINEFENAKTHDLLWNSAQIQLIKEGKIHGYLRMYWAKKILEWSENAEIAVKIAIYLNDKYAYDAPSPNGYVGILWSIGALHDRAFGERPIFGKIRPMTYNGAKSKFKVSKYIDNYIDFLGCADS